MTIYSIDVLISQFETTIALESSFGHLIYHVHLDQERSLTTTQTLLVSFVLTYDILFAHILLLAIFIT